jgi:hypothetical protein
MTPQEAQEHLAKLQQEEMEYFRQREVKIEQRDALDKDIQYMSQKLLTLRAVRETYMLATIAMSPTVESNSGRPNEPAAS